MTASLAVMVLVMVFGSLLNHMDETAEGEPDPFRLDRFRRGETEAE
jgi:hypothetical protein